MELKEIFDTVLADEIERRLAILMPREREVFLLRRGFDRNGELQSYAAIGRELDLTRERVRQIYASAEWKLKENSGDGVAFGIPILSCQCGKYRGKRFREIRCDKCGKEVGQLGKLQTRLVNP